MEIKFIQPSNIQHSNIQHSNIQDSNIQHSNIQHSNILKDNFNKGCLLVMDNQDMLLLECKDILRDILLLYRVLLLEMGILSLLHKITCIKVKEDKHRQIFRTQKIRRSI